MGVFCAGAKARPSLHWLWVISGRDKGKCYAKWKPSKSTLCVCVGGKEGGQRENCFYPNGIRG